MNYRHPELRRALAAEYVVGTMTPRVQRRFERLMATDVLMRAEVNAWEDTLYPTLTELTDAVTPPARVWQSLDAQLDAAYPKDPPAEAAPGLDVRPVPAPILRGPARWFDRVGVWQATTALATAASLVLAVLVFSGLSRPSDVDLRAFTAVIGTDDLRVGWLVRSAPPANDDAGRVPLLVTSISDHSIDTRVNSYQLWQLPGLGQGDDPIPLGLLPAIGEDSVLLTREQFEALAGAAGFLVSLEPAGGSPTGQPTGKITARALTAKSI